MSVDLSTKYLGLELSNPVVVASCPLTGDLSTLEQLQQAGAAAVVLPSLFAEQITDDNARVTQAYGHPTFGGTPPYPGSNRLGVIPPSSTMANYNTGPDGYLKHVELAKNAASIPVIGSLNAASRGGWTRFAKLIEQAGADALELNIYFLPTDAETTSQDVERRYFEIVAAVREEISIPLAVKIGPFFTALPNIARGLVQAGADGLVLFNRYLEPEFDLDGFEIQPHLDLSQRSELRLPLRWIALLRDQLDVSLAATSGIQDARDAVKALAAGADVVMIASSLLRYGPDYVSQLLAGIRGWMEDKQYFSVEQVRGLMSRSRCADASALERANYMQALSSYVEDDQTEDHHNE